MRHSAHTNGTWHGDGEESLMESPTERGGRSSLLYVRPSSLCRFVGHSSPVCTSMHERMNATHRVHTSSIPSEALHDDEPRKEQSKWSTSLSFSPSILSLPILSFPYPPLRPFHVIVVHLARACHVSVYLLPVPLPLLFSLLPCLNTYLFSFILGSFPRGSAELL